jgi:hypothetical protein
MHDDNNFGSIERLIEFGMSMAVAQQMVQTMNYAIQNMNVPTFKETNVGMPSAREFYAVVNDIPQGPFTESKLREHMNSGEVTASTMVWTSGMPNWLPAHLVPAVDRLLRLTPPPFGNNT